MRDLKRWPKIREAFCRKHFTPRLYTDLTSLAVELPYTDTSPSMYIYGSPETGKTVTAAFLAVEWYKHLWVSGKSPGKTFKFLSYPTLGFQLKSTFNSKDVTEFEVLQDYMNADLLVIDDIGVGKVAGSDWALTCLYVLINHRYEYNKQTIITSNLSLEQLADVIDDERIPSRIQRMCKIFEKQTWKANT